MIPKPQYSITPLAFALLATLCGQASAQDARFNRLDKNGDGNISREEAKGTFLEARFDTLDRNRDGFLTPDEVLSRRAARRAPADGAAEGVVTHMDIRYAEAPPGADPDHLSLDVYAPEGAENLPVMIYIHGGGWRTGDMRSIQDKPDYFIGRGFVFVSINYRLVPAVDILTQLQDSANAIGWVKKNISRHGGDPARLHLIGHSAGAHHVAVLATNERFLQKAGVALGDLKSVVELDTQALDVPKLMRGSNNALYIQAFGKDPEVWKQVSPCDNVAKDNSIPPFFLVVANERGPKRAQAAAFQKALHAAGVHCEFIEAPQHDHGSLNRAIGDQADKVTQAMEKFHESVLGVKKSAAGNVRGLPDGKAMHEWVKAYAALGEHRAASAVDAKTADWLAGELRHAGLAVSFQEFTVPQFQLEEVRLTVAGRTIAAFPRWPVRDATVSGPLTAENTKVVQGRVVLLEAGHESRRAGDARLRKLAESGAVGVVQLVANAEGEFSVENLAQPDAEPLSIPVVRVVTKDRNALLRAAQSGESAEISIAGEWQPQARARNVIATLDRGARRIVVSTPYSGWFRCGGERGSGLAVFLALAHWAAAQDSATSFTFVANSAHELGYAGMMAYLEGPAPPAKDVLAWMHASGDGPEAIGPSVLEPVARALCDALSAIQEAQRDEVTDASTDTEKNHQLNLGIP